MRILAITFLHAISKAKSNQNIGIKIDEVFLREQDEKFRVLRQQYPNKIQEILLTDLDEPPNIDPFAELEIELTDYGVRRILESPIDKLAQQRFAAIRSMSEASLTEYSTNVEKIISIFAKWMRTETVVHVIGAGRALLAASLAANRLAHGGARVYILGDKSPPPSSRFGGGIIAASASGKTPVVLEIMARAQELIKEPGQRPIIVVGLSDPDAPIVPPFHSSFRDFCTTGYFLGIRKPQNSEVHLRGLADLEEQTINQVLDALVVAAGLECGVSFRLGHEDLVGGATGPWHR